MNKFDGCKLGYSGNLQWLMNIIRNEWMAAKYSVGIEEATFKPGND